jgi:hypothetical protein
MTLICLLKLFPLKSTIFWAVMWFSLVEMYQYFRQMYSHNLQARSKTSKHQAALFLLSFQSFESALYTRCDIHRHSIVAVRRSVSLYHSVTSCLCKPINYCGIPLFTLCFNKIQSVACFGPNRTIFRRELYTYNHSETTKSIYRM